MRALLSVIAFVFAVTIPFASNAQSARPQLLKPLPATVAKSGNAPGVRTQALPIRFNAEEMLALRYRDEVELTLPNAATHAVVFELAQAHGGGIHSWIGYLKEKGPEYRVIVTSGPAGSYGVIDAPDGSFRIVPGDGQHDWLVDMTQEQLYLPMIDFRNDTLVPPPEAKSLPPPSAPVTFYDPIPGVNTVGLAKATPSMVTVDLMVVVTKAFADRLGPNLATRINFLVTRANTSYADSEVGITLRLVNYTIVDYTDTNGNSTALNEITNGAGVFSTIEATRTQYGADVVALLRNGSDFGGSGIAWLGTPSTAPYMYSVTTGCVSGCESVFIHEVGHNMGNAHDRNTVAWQDGGTATPSTGLFSYSYGYAFCKSGALSCNPLLLNGSPGACPSNQQPECSTDDPSSFSDIMAYFHATTERLYRFSNPSLADCKAVGTGSDGINRACGDATANTALSMNNNRATMAAMKPTIVGAISPGSIQFKETGYSGAETAGTITFTVSRSALAGAGPVSVSYSVAGGSATAGVDFVAASGTLSWADGDLADKTFNVTLVNDQTAEGIETFTATLSNPTGTAGVYLGHPATASGIILETWPAGDVLPAGFVTPDGSSGAWTTATDQAFEGTTSLRSAQIVGPGGSAFANSDLTQTASLPAGQLAFAYRVSSYPGYGFLEFLVDGVVVLSDTGETGWKVFQYTLPTAKSYTLKWRFKNSLTFNCRFAIPAPPGGANCADRAWIDALALPASLAASSVTIASNANPASVGQNVTFTATVTGSGGTGTVTFFDGGAKISGCEARPIASSQATCSTSALTAGAHNITAGYSGTTTVAASLSSALSQSILSSKTLTVTKAGAGSGTVTSNPAGINCGATCAADFSAGSSVTLTAAAAGGSVFTGWSGGGCSGTGTCVVTMSDAVTVTATFATQSGSLALTATPASLAFGGQSMGTTSPAQVVTVTNVGNGTVTVSGVATSDAQFAQTHNCTTLAVGASCTVNVSFSPAVSAGALLSTVAAGGSLTVTSDATTSPNAVPLSGTAEKSLVTHYYRAILNRAPDAAGKAFWEGEAARLAGLGVDVNETWYVMAGYFYNSAEYLGYGKNDTQFVTDLYNTFFNRGPDAGGLAYWTGQIAGGVPREVVLFSFMFSPEFRTFNQAIFGDTSARAEVNVVIDFFRGILNRLPDTASFNYWLGRMRTAQCAGAGAVYAEVNNSSYNFIFSAEYAGRNRNNTQFVTDMYYSFLRRGGDAGGVQYWINELNTGARTIANVRDAFIASPEFNTRVNAIVAQGCLP